MADDFIESLLEAPYKSEDEGSTDRMDTGNAEARNKNTEDNGIKKKSKKDKHGDSYMEEESEATHKKGSHKKKERKEYEENGHKDSSHSIDERKKKDKKQKYDDRDHEHSSSRHEPKKDKKHSRPRSRSRSKRRSSSRTHSSHRKRSDSRDPPRKRSHHRSSSRRLESRHRDGDDRRSRQVEDDRRRGRLSPIPKATEVDLDLTPEERDQRTVLFMQLGPYVTERDIMDFLKSVGKNSCDVRDIRLIVDSRTRKSKGLAYVEFLDPNSVQFALGLNGQKVKGRPIVVQHSQAEKNRLAILASGGLQKGHVGPMKLYVGSLHPNISEEMLKGIFEPFGKIDFINLIMDLESNKSRGYGFIQFHDGEDAKRALESLNGFELAGKPMKVSKFNERFGLSLTPAPSHSIPQQPDYTSLLDTEELEKTGVDLGATGRLQLMAKLAEGTGMKMPPAAQSALEYASSSMGSATAMSAIRAPLPMSAAQPPIATPCFMLSNMFDPQNEVSSDWDVEIRDDVIEECDKHGGVQHIFIDKISPQGNVYVKCLTTPAAVSSVNSLHGRWFAGKMITAAYIPLANYYTLFGDAITATERLKLSASR